MTQFASDRNLLAAQIAVQRGVVLPEGLRAIEELWVDGKDDLVEEALLRHGMIDLETAQLIRQLVEQELSSADQDIEATLESPLPAAKRKNDSDTSSVVSEATIDQASSVTLPPQDSAAVNQDGRPSGSRFEVLRHHAKGGLGEVAIALDCELNREVALKTIQERFADDSNSKARFTIEAEVTGSLEHPGIVPVYGFGFEQNGRPFYAMRLIRGESMKEAIKRFYRSLDEDSGVDAHMQFRRLLTSFVDVCQAIEYAHSRGILHRDLKPGNIMLGKYGETLVVDWGLAKVVGASSPASEPMDETTLIPNSSGDAPPTMMGAAVGTPAFMSPEQAAGRLHKLSPQSDIYSLGATLYALLTGRAAFRGKDPRSTIDDVIAGDFSPPKSMRSDVPKALNAICMKAMSLRPEHRYERAKDLASDIENWLADEPVTARTEPWPERTWRWIRKHRSLALTALAASILIAATSVVAVVVVNKFRAEARISESKAINEREIAEQARDESKKISNFLVAALSSPNPIQENGVDVTVAEMLDGAVDKLNSDFQDAPLTRAAMANAVAEAYRGLGDLEKASSLAQIAFEIREKILGQLHTDTLLALNNLTLIEIYRRGNRERAIDLSREHLERTTTVHGPDHKDTLVASSNCALALMHANNFDDATPILRELATRFDRVVGPNDRLTLNCRHNLASALMMEKCYSEAIEVMQNVVRSRRENYGNDHYETFRSLSILADIYRYMANESGDKTLRLKSRDIFQDIVHRSARTLGPKHRETIRNLRSLITQELKLNSIDAHTPSAEHLSTAYPKAIEDEPSGQIAGIDLMAEIFHSQNDLKNATKLCETSYQRSCQQNGTIHRESLLKLESLVDMLELQLDRHDEIIAYLIDLNSGWNEIESPNSRNARQTLFQLFQAYYYAERHEKVIELEPLVLKNMTESDAAASLVSATCVFYATSLVETKQYQKAETVLRGHLEEYVSKVPSLWTIGQCRVLLGRALTMQERYQEAEPLLLLGNRNLETRKTQFKLRMKSIEPIVKSYDYLIELYQRQGDQAKEQEWKQKAAQRFPTRQNNSSKRS